MHQTRKIIANADKRKKKKTKIQLQKKVSSSTNTHLDDFLYEKDKSMGRKGNEESSKDLKLKTLFNSMSRTNTEIRVNEKTWLSVKDGQNGEFGFHSIKYFVTDR